MACSGVSPSRTITANSWPFIPCGYTAASVPSATFTPLANACAMFLRAAGITSFALASSGGGRRVSPALSIIQCVLRSLRIVSQGQHAAGRAHFNEIRAVLDVLPHLVLHTRNAVRNAIADCVIFGREHIVVAVAARNAQSRPADQHPGPRYIAGVDGVAQSDVTEATGAYVANRRESRQ